MQNSGNSGSGQLGQSAILDATDTYCPELFLVIRRFISSQLGKSRFIQIGTRENRAENRIKHICIEYGYSYKMREENGIYLFLLDLNAGNNEHLT